MIVANSSNCFTASPIKLPNGEPNPFNYLHRELIRFIFSYLEFQTVQKVQLTCRVFYQVANDSSLPCYKWIFESPFIQNLEDKSKISKEDCFKKYAHKYFFRNFCDLLTKENKLDKKLLELAAEQGSLQAIEILVDLKHIEPSRIRYFALRGFEKAIHAFLLYSAARGESWGWEEYFASKRSPSALQFLTRFTFYNTKSHKDMVILLENLAEQGVEAAIETLLKCQLHGLLGLSGNEEKYIELARKYIDRGSEVAIKELIENSDDQERQKLAAHFAEKKSSSGIAAIITGHTPIDLADPLVELTKSYAAQGYECAIHQLCFYYSKILNTDPSLQLELIEPYAEKGSEGAITVLLSLPLPKEELLRLAIKYLRKGSIAAAQNLVRIFQLCQIDV